VIVRVAAAQLKIFPTMNSALHRVSANARAVWVLGSHISILIEAHETNGEMSMIQVIAPAGDGGPPPHVHEREDELFHIHEGQIDIHCDGKTTTIKPAEVVFVPRGTLHTFSNPHASPCRFTVIYTPGGFEGFFIDIGIPAIDHLHPPPPAPPDMTRLVASATKHHMTFPTLNASS
jgi:mannose-6-phosphate isomerase-like protein (cupin superfamily)